MDLKKIEEFIEEINVYSHSEEYELNEYNKEAIRFLLRNVEFKKVKGGVLK